MMSREDTPRRGGMARNFVHLGIGQVATTVLTVLLSATLARMLSPSDFGLVYLLTSVAVFAFVIAEWGHGAILIREAARNPDRTGELLGSTLVVRAAIALVASACAVVMTWLLDYDVRTRVLAGLMILCWLPQYLGFSFGWAFRAHERMDRDALINVVLKLATLLGSIAWLSLGGHLPGLVVSWSVAGCVTLSIAVVLYRRLQLPKIKVTVSTIRTLMRDGAPLLITSLAVFLEPFLNTNILYGLASPTVVGWHGAAWTIAGTLVAPATVLTAAMYPRLSVAMGNAAEFRRTFDVLFRPLLLLAVLGAVGTYLFADVPVGIIYSLQNYGPAADNLRAFAPVLLLLYLDMFLGIAIVAAGKTGRLALIKLTAVALTTGLVFVLAPFCQARYGNGGLGVMYAMTVSEVLILVAFLFQVRDTIDGRMAGDMLRSLVAGAATVLLFRLLPAFTPFLAIPMCILVFAGLSLLVGAVKGSDMAALRASFRR